MMELFESGDAVRVVPVVVLDRAEDAVPTAQALLAGGVDKMEITFRTEAALEAICSVARNVPEMCAGAGTVLTRAQAETAVKSGARFIVSPGFDEDTVKWCLQNGVPVVPGCVTPTEILRALALGIRTVKFFPANVYGGLPAMKALSAPFPGVQFIPTGGVAEKNLAEYLSAPFVRAVGGSWICTREDIRAHRFERITQLCRDAGNYAKGAAK